MQTLFSKFLVASGALFVGLSLGVVCASSVAQTKPPGAFATVNGVPVPQSLIDTNVKVNIAQGQKDSPELRQVIQDELIDLYLMVKIRKST
jgi:peptidyl-prolyl cis-trans isomerase C